MLLGLAVARTSAGLAVHTTVSFAGYVAGTALGVRITGRGEARGSAGGPGSGPGSGRAWPAHVTAALVTELVLMALFTAGWEISGASPAGSAQLLLLAAAAAAMGTQTAAVRSLGLAEISTTYLTGTLAGVITALVTPDRSARRRARVGLRRPGALLALAAGAGLGGLLIATAATVLPVVQLAVLIAVIAIGARNSRTRPREVRRGRPAAG